MRATFAIAALAGSALAAPSYGRPQGNHKNVHVVVETVVHTVYVTEGYEVTKPTPSPEPVYEAPEVTSTVVYEEPKPSSKYEAPAEPTPVPEAPKPTPTPEPVPETPPPSTNEGYMAIVDEYRSKMGLSALAQDGKLESNAKDCAASGNGQMVHKLNPGSFAQVLAPGDCSNFMETFKKAFVGGWLCELPNTPGLDDCGTMSEGWAYEGQTGHAEILTSPSYSKIGCGCEGGIVACDLS